MIVELRKIRFALADIENQLEFALEQAQNKIEQLQNNYQTALQEIDKLNTYQAQTSWRNSATQIRGPECGSGWCVTGWQPWPAPRG